MFTVEVIALSQETLEIQLSADVSVSAGQTMRLSSPTGDRVYGSVSHVDVLPNNDGTRVQLLVASGTPSATLNQGTWLSPTAVSHELSQLLDPMDAPLILNNQLMGDWGRLGPITVIEGENLEAKQQALVDLLDHLGQTRPVLVIDPLGWFSLAQDYHVLLAGQDVQLSLQDVGIPSFLELMGQELPEAFEEKGLGLLSRGIPMTSDFIPFVYLLRQEHYGDSSVTPALMHLLHGINQHGIFANGKETAFHLDRVLSLGPLSVLDLSSLPSQWQSVYYHHILNTLIEKRGQYAGEWTPVLIVPEQFIDGEDLTVHHLLQSGYRSMVVLGANDASSDTATTLGEFTRQANNTFFVEHPPGNESVWVHLCGDMTCGLTTATVLYGEMPQDEILESEQYEQDADLIDVLSEEGESTASTEMSSDPGDETLSTSQKSDCAYRKRLPKHPEFKPFCDPLKTPDIALTNIDPPVEEAVLENVEAYEPELLAEPEHFTFSEEGEHLEEDLFEEEALEDSDTAFVEDTTGKKEELEAITENDPFDEFNFSAELPDDIAVGLPDPLDVAALNDSNESDEFNALSEMPPQVAEALGPQAAMLQSLIALGDKAQKQSQAQHPSSPNDPTHDETLPTTHGIHSTDDVLGTPTAQSITVEPEPYLPPESKPSLPEPPPPADLEPLAQIQRERDEQVFPFAPGQRVEHAKYGSGTVEKIIPMDGRYTVKVDFDTVGKRLLDAQTGGLNT